MLFSSDVTQRTIKQMTIVTMMMLIMLADNKD